MITELKIKEQENANIEAENKQRRKDNLPEKPRHDLEELKKALGL